MATVKIQFANPWSCQSLFDYLYFCCPECNQKWQIKQDFVNHAINDHPISLNFLKEINDNSIDDINLSNNHDVEATEIEESVIDLKIENDEDFESEDIANTLFEEGKNKDIKNEDPLKVEDDCLEKTDEEVISKPLASKDKKSKKKKQSKTETFNDRCPDCNFTTSDKNKLRRHVISAHSGKFECEYCDYKTYNQIALDIHTNALHTKATKFHCEQCEFFSYTKGGVQSHVRTAHLNSKNDNFQCEYCEFKTSHRSSIIKHTNAIHTKATKYHCEQCEFFSYSKGGVNEHVRIVHLNIKRPRSKDILCTQCGQAFERTRDLKMHELKIHGIASEYTSKYMGNVKIQCDKCQETFDTTSKLNDHAKSCGNDEIKTIPCTICEMELVTGNVSLIHMKIDHNQVKAVLCNLCGKSFSSKGALSTHVKGTHEKNFDHICETCGKGFISDYILKRHIQTVHEKTGFHFQCDYCEKRFSRKKNKSEHENRAHTKKIKFPCDQCDYVTFIKGLLVTHKQRKHEKWKYSCPQCDHKALKSSELENHIDAIHNGKFTCEQCGLKAGSQKKLDYHINTVHTKDQKFSCEECNFFTYHKNNLHVHIKNIHLKLKPHKCSSCSKGFARKRELEKHNINCSAKNDLLM